MADFDFTFRCKDECMTLGRLLLHRSQKMAKNLDLEFRFKAMLSGWYVTVDGPLTSMQALIQPMVVKLRPFAEGYTKPKLRSQRIKVVERLVNEYRNGVVSISENIENVSHFFGSSSNSYFFDEGANTHLSAFLREFEQSLILFRNGLLSASIFAEVAHTISEAVLKTCLPKNERKGSFNDLLNRVTEISKLTDEQRQVLLRLKDMRKKAKHQGQRVKYAEMASDLNKIIAVLHFLFSFLRSNEDDIKDR